MDIVSRKEAIERGLTRYFTGKACKQGHVAQRQTISATCITCLREASHRNKQNAAAAILAKRQAETA